MPQVPILQGSPDTKGAIEFNESAPDGRQAGRAAQLIPLSMEEFLNKVASLTQDFQANGPKGADGIAPTMARIYHTTNFESLTDQLNVSFTLGDSRSSLGGQLTITKAADGTHIKTNLQSGLEEPNAANESSMNDLLKTVYGGLLGTQVDQPTVAPPQNLNAPAFHNTKELAGFLKTYLQKNNIAFSEISVDSADQIRIDGPKNHASDIGPYSGGDVTLSLNQKTGKLKEISSAPLESADFPIINKIHNAVLVIAEAGQLNMTPAPKPDYGAALN